MDKLCHLLMAFSKKLVFAGLFAYFVYEVSKAVQRLGNKGQKITLIFPSFQTFTNPQACQFVTEK